MRIETLLQIIMIIIALTIILDKDNLRLVIFSSAFSLIAASLYYMNKSPDVALAEAAIGSAIIPLIFIIAIEKQKQFIVVNHLNDEFLDRDTGKGYKVLEEFAKHYGLKLSVYKNDDGQIQGAFRERNIDLIVEKSPQDNRKYLFIGKKASILMNKLEQMTKDIEDIKIIKVEESERYD
ncbi:Na(+)/H(+) antiporter subunit B [Thermohalobacter berrensis]|uniref:MrpA C-terminal/MbhD domain-containing protein n=1 Tax=Thermohalobacter berrensis TaxID=99594 RepID=A0A419SZ86_9FIRM|nr:hydrogenase subunit MbhD domain-containing protein [Thermohalobacter berrensis]RKD30577.1 hypothetical protein BET03_04365 [Thermohalobacter berrensis]